MNAQQLVPTPNLKKISQTFACSQTTAGTSTRTPTFYACKSLPYMGGCVFVGSQKLHTYCGGHSGAAVRSSGLGAPNYSYARPSVQTSPDYSGSLLLLKLAGRPHSLLLAQVRASTFTAAAAAAASLLGKGSWSKKKINPQVEQEVSALHPPTPTLSCDEYLIKTLVTGG